MTPTAPTAGAASEMRLLLGEQTHEGRSMAVSIAEKAALVAQLDPDIAASLDALIQATLQQAYDRRIASHPDVQAAYAWMRKARVNARFAAARADLRSHAETRGPRR